MSATVPLNRDRSRAKLRIAEPLSTWVCSTTRESRISAVVTSKLALAVSMNELEVSMIWPMLGPASLNAAPDSETTVRRSDCGTELTKLLEVGEDLGGGHRDLGLRRVPIFEPFSR